MFTQGKYLVVFWGHAGADQGGGGWAAQVSLTPNFEAQIFVAAATLLCNVDKISLAPPLHKSWIHTCHDLNISRKIIISQQKTEH